MPIVRSLTNGRKVTDWTEEVNNIPVLSGMINAMGLFNERGSAATSVTFTRKLDKTYRLFAWTSRRERDVQTDVQTQAETFAIPIPYANVVDTLTTEDILEQREWNDPNAQTSVERAMESKIMDMRIRGDQTKEYVKLQALKGLIVNPKNGATTMSMFTEFGQSQNTVDFLLGTTTTDINGKINEVLRAVRDNNQSGLPGTLPIVVVGKTFIDKLINHDKVVQRYQYFSTTGGVNPLRDNLFDFTAWGGGVVFKHAGVVFVEYNPTFTLADGNTSQPIADNDGYVILPSARDLYRGYNGPSNKFSKLGQVGAPMSLYQWAQDKDNGWDFELEVAPLYFMTNPTMSIKVTTSN